jgi:hypothetical protein
VGQLSLHVSKIFCASEIPAAMEPLMGVHKVSVNVTTKTVYVDHDLQVVIGEDMAKALNAQRFGATVKKDASKMRRHRTNNNDATTTPRSKFVETTLFVESFDPTTDIRTVQNVFAANLTKQQVHHFDTHLTWVTFKVDHNPSLVPAQILQLLLEKEGLKIHVVSDGEVDGRWTMPLTESSSKDDEIEKHHATVNPFVVASGVFCRISMLLLLGGSL